MDRDLFVLQGPGLLKPDERALADAYEAGAAERAHLAAQRFSFGDPGHLVRVVAAILLIAFVPGMLALRWFGRTDLPFVLGLAPPLSLAMNLTVGFILLGVVRKPMTPAMAWTIVAAASALGGAAWWRGRRRPLALPEDRATTQPEPVSVV